jgi:hypothetical protein
MNKSEILNWSGGSGEKYPFEIWNINAEFPDEEGNYTYIFKYLSNFIC